MKDIAHEYTDKQIEKMTRRLRSEYSRATKELTKKTAAYFERFAEQDAKKKAELEAGKITKEQYRKWRVGKMTTGNRYKEMIQQSTNDLNHVDEIAAQIINDQIPQVYAENMNFTTYMIEDQAHVNTSFTLYDRKVVKQIIAEEPDYVPQAAVDKMKNVTWINRRVNSELLQGIMQGESTDAIAKRIAHVTGMNFHSSVTTARTISTKAEGMARQEAYQRAEDIGLKGKKEWISTLDTRTRDTHVLANGQIVGLTDTFTVGGYQMIEAGDESHGAPFREVVNCRCTTAPIMYGIQTVLPKNIMIRDSSVSYSEWKKGAGTHMTIEQWRAEAKERYERRKASESENHG